MTVFDDDGTICALRRAPYACTWTPTGADVGRATLLASAVDSAGLSTLGIVRVRVTRFEADLAHGSAGAHRAAGAPAAVERPPRLPRGVTRRGRNRERSPLKVSASARRAARPTVTRRCTYSRQAAVPPRPRPRALRRQRGARCLT